ncbi:hypothetical protein [Mammaliicoccus sciuri]|uniref:hypothetical protein n=1 Tax=Mammaliicoccus sciuri TaxID=1296 RepID=UPI0018B0881E|nr:hypothetical protein [Mammaliicoccus sciuri]MBF9298764.1 hypothetical protein [Staphylococcus schleiferi]MDO0948179.1 hypothetical protein [Mammaliicoccus sciuri]
MNIISINHDNDKKIEFETELCKQVGEVMNFYTNENYPIIHWFDEPHVLIENKLYRLSSIVSHHKAMNKQKFLVKYGMKTNFKLTI